MRSALAVLAFAPALALAEFTNPGALVRGELERVAQDLGAAFSYKGVTPGTSLGMAGFDIGLEVTDTTVKGSELFRRAGAGSPSRITVPKLHVHKGLPGGFDVGAFIAAASEVDAALYGLDLRYAVVQDGLATPGVALRLSGTRATGLGQVRLGTAAADVMVSKRLAFFTPYAGTGIVRTTLRASGTSVGEVRADEGRYFAGINLNLVAINVAVEAEKSGENRSISAKLGWRF